MLTSLVIQNIVLIEQLAIQFGDQLNVMTGETGAGKSILLDALGLAIGARGDRALVRVGCEKGMAVATFDIPDDHPAHAMLEEQGLSCNDDCLILRREISAEGRSRGWINDQPVSQSLLAGVGSMLVEIHGQHDDRGMLDPASHLRLLDSYAGLLDDVRQCGDCWQQLAKAETLLSNRIAAMEKAQRDEDYLRHAFEELEQFSPSAGEEQELANRRALMMQGEKAHETLASIQELVAGENGLDGLIRTIVRRLERFDASLEEVARPTLEAFTRANIEIGEGMDALDALVDQLQFDPVEMERVEERLFEYRRLARKHDCQCDDLPAILDDVEQKLADLTRADKHIVDAQKQVEQLRYQYAVLAKELSSRRVTAAAGMDAAINGELLPLKLENATFRTRIVDLGLDGAGPTGLDKVMFEVQTNKGTDFGPLSKIASGGELARFILAIKVVLSAAGTAPVLIFDEVDRGIGGATADAVGDRLARLADNSQILVVTHSPQVAAKGSHHFIIEKQAGGQDTRTHVSILSEQERYNEVARMLAGASITNEARAAAVQLIKGTAG